jgi:hypothetical protein
VAGATKKFEAILWQQGLIDVSALEKFTLDGKKIRLQARLTYNHNFAISLPNARTSMMKRRRLSS